MQNYDVGNRIYELRKEKGLSQKELGALIGVSKKAKTYLICVFSLFIAVTILILTIYVAVSTGGYIEKSNIFMSFAMGYLIASVYTGITLFVDIIKKIPEWLSAILCVLFVFTFSVIEIAGAVMCIPQIIKSVQILIKSRKEKDKNG